MYVLIYIMTNMLEYADGYFGRPIYLKELIITLSKYEKRMHISKFSVKLICDRYTQNCTGKISMNISQHRMSSLFTEIT